MRRDAAAGVTPAHLQRRDDHLRVRLYYETADVDGPIGQQIVATGDREEGGTWDWGRQSRLMWQGPR